MNPTTARKKGLVLVSPDQLDGLWAVFRLHDHRSSPVGLHYRHHIPAFPLDRTVRVILYQPGFAGVFTPPPGC